MVSCLLTLALQEGGRRKAAQQLLLLQEVRDKALVSIMRGGMDRALEILR